MCSASHSIAPIEHVDSNEFHSLLSEATQVGRWKREKRHFVVVRRGGLDAKKATKLGTLIRPLWEAGD